MKRPLIPMAFLYVGGLLLGRLPIPLVPIFVLAFSVAILCLAWPATRRMTFAALIVMTGWVNLAQRATVLSPFDLRSRFGQLEQIVNLRGVFVETPIHRAHEFRGRHTWSTSARIDVSATQSVNGEWLPAYGRIISSTSEYLPDEIFAGQAVEISGVLREVKRPLAEGLFDYRGYLEQQGIYYELEVKSGQSWRVVESARRPPLADRFCAWARKTLAKGLPVEDETLRLEWALTLGWKSAMTDEIAEPFMQAGTYHIFAVDGLRVAIIAGIFLGLLRSLGVLRAYCGLLTAPLVCFYAAMTGWPASAIRAIVMAVIIFGGWFLNRPSDLLNSLFAAAFVILLWEPRQLFQAGFQLSFLVVLCIILLMPSFEKILRLLLQRDEMRPLARDPVWQTGLRHYAQFMGGLFLVSLAAWLGSIPLVAWYFHLVTPLSGPANMFAVPLCALVLICNLSALLFAPLLPGITVLFNYVGWFFMDCIRASSAWSAHWPGAYFYVAMPGLFTIALYYLVLITILTGWLYHGKLRFWKMGAISILMIAWCGVWISQLNTARLTILPLNGGHAIYVEERGHLRDGLIDCGNEACVENVTAPFLHAQGVNRLSKLLLTHGEINFSGGAQAICDLFQPHNIYTAAARFRSLDYRNFVDQNKGQPPWRTPLMRGDLVGPWTVLCPSAQMGLTRADDNVLVLIGEINSARLLLLSDMSHAGQNALLSQTNNLHADIVIAGLPNDGEPLCDALLDAIAPRVIVIADSEQPANKRAGDKLRQRLAHRNIPVIYTSDGNAVTLVSRVNDWELSAMDGTKIASADLPKSR